MKTVRFTRNYDYRQKVQKSGMARRVTSYKADGGPGGDGVYEVSDDAAEAAVGEGAAELVEQPVNKKKGADTPPAPPPASGDVTTHTDVRG